MKINKRQHKILIQIDRYEIKYPAKTAISKWELYQIGNHSKLVATLKRDDCRIYVDKNLSMTCKGNLSSEIGTLSHMASYAKQNN